MTMTKQEYDNKAANGTLTYRDISENREYATTRQLHNLEILERKRATAVETAYYAVMLTVYQTLCDLPERYATATLLDDWGELCGDNTGAETTRTTLDIADDLEYINKGIKQILSCGVDLPKDKYDRLVELNEIINKLNEDAQTLRQEK